MPMEGLPIEAQFEHRKFLTQVNQMDESQMRVMLEKLHLSFLGHRQFIKDTMRTQLGIDAVPLGELD
jgi:hypothetical protein